MANAIGSATYNKDSATFPLSKYLQNIIDKKVNGIALSCIESIVHWFLITFSCLYPAYSNLYHQRTDKFIDKTGLLDSFPDRAQRIRYFPDGVGLIDLTAQRIVSLKPVRTPFVQCQPPSVESVNIAIHNRAVIFNPSAQGSRHSFGKKHHTVYITVKDSSDHPNTIEITEHKTMGRISQWKVDTTKKFTEHLKLQNRGGQFTVSNPVYVPEEIIPSIQDPHYLEPEQGSFWSNLFQ